MSGSLGSLVVEVAANVARFQSDMGRVAYIAQQNANLVQRAFDTVGSSLKALGAGLSVGLAVDTVKTRIEQAIQSAAGLEDLAQRTGGTIEGLSRLSNVAEISGTSTDTLASGLQRLAKNMVEAGQGGAGAVAAFESLGISTKGLASQRPEEVFTRVATELSKYEDNAAKTALAQELLGKSGANLLPMMNDLVTVGGLAAVTTAEQAAAAEEYEINLLRLQVTGDAVFKTIALQIVPVMGSFVKVLVSSANSTDGLRATVDRLAVDGSLRKWAEETAMGIARFIDVLSVLPDLFMAVGKTLAAGAAQFAGLGQVLGGVFQILSGDIRSGIQTAQEGLKQITAVGNLWWQDMQQIWNRPLFSDRFKQQLAADAQNVMQGMAKKPSLPSLKLVAPDSGALKAEVDAQLKVLERQIQQEQQLYQTRQQLLQRLYGQDLLSISAYFAAREASTEAYRQQTLALYDQEIADLQRAMARMADVRAKTELAGRIQEIDQRKQKVVNEVERQTVLDRLDQAKATQAYADEVERLNIRLLELQGNLQEAATRQGALQNRSIRQRLTVEQDLPALDTLQRIEDLQGAQAALSQFAAQAALVDERLRTAEGRIVLDQQTGAATELQTLERLGQARQAAAVQLSEIAQQMDAVAQASGNPAMVAHVEAFKLRIEQLAVSAEALGTTFREIFVGGFSGLLTDLMQGTKSLKDAFLDFARSVEAAITRIVAQNLAQQLFGAGGPLGGISSLVGSLFGMAAPTPAATGAGVISSGSGLVISGMRADGGPVAANQSYLVGERGPEVFKPTVPGRIVSNERMRAGALGNSPSRISGPTLAAMLLAPLVPMAPSLAASALPAPAAITPAAALPASPTTPPRLTLAASLAPVLTQPLRAAGPAQATASAPSPSTLGMRNRVSRQLEAPVQPTIGGARNTMAPPRAAGFLPPAITSVLPPPLARSLTPSISLSIAGSLRDGGPAYRNPVQRNPAYAMGEAGPKVFDTTAVGTGLSNEDGANSMPSIVINNRFAAGTDLRTIDQAATQIGQRVQRALRRSS